MAEVAGRTVYVFGTINGTKSVVVTFTTAATGDTITLSSGTEYGTSTILSRSVHAQGTGDVLASVTVASNQLTLGVSTGVGSGYAAIFCI